MMVTIIGPYTSSFVKQVFYNSHSTGYRLIFEVPILTSPLGTFGLWAATLYPGNHERQYKLWNNNKYVITLTVPILQFGWCIFNIQVLQERCYIEKESNVFYRNTHNSPAGTTLPFRSKAFFFKLLICMSAWHIHHYVPKPCLLH